MNDRTSTLIPTYAPEVSPHGRAARNAMARLLRRLPETLRCWHQRQRQRRALAELDDRLLQDIGLTRVDANREIRKPFWKA